MRLKDWKDQKQLKNKDLAASLDIDEGYVTHILKGDRRPSPELALKIEQLTKGMVSRMDVLYPEE